jgi:serine/threonine-protein kinase
VAPAGPQPPAKQASKVKPPRKRRRGWIALVAVVVLGALVAWLGWSYGLKTVPVPAVVGLTPTAAEAKLSPLGLTLDSATQEFSETVKKGLIISTDPPSGSDAREGSTVAAVVSKGPERYAVPQVASMTVEDATQALLDASLAVGASTSAYDEKIKVGLVVTTDPKPTSLLKRDQPVDLVISKGPAPVKIPDLTGKTLAAATTALTKLGLKVTSTEEYSKTVAKGAVVSSTPKPGATANKGTSVALVVSKGPPLVSVPDVYRVPEAEARAALRKAGFNVTVTYPIGFTPFGRVVAQSIDAGKKVPFGSTIEIQVV